MPSNRDIFFQEIFDIPKKRNNKDFYTTLSELYDEFLVQVKHFDGKVKDRLIPHYSTIEYECDMILQALKAYFTGYTTDAYNKIKLCLNELESNNLLEIEESVSNNLKANFYRVRTAANQNLSRKDLFHIPFNLREKVSTQRYSIPGLPCLYLSDSVFVAWEELGRPDFDIIHASRFDLSASNFKFLHLNITANDMRRRCFKSFTPTHVNQLAKFISYFPLLVACSFIVEKKDEPFKPEYIVPQLVLQWVTDIAKVDGIQYKSNRIKTSNNNVGSFANLAIPVKSFSDTGYCTDLSKKILLTAPLSWALMQIADPINSFLSKQENIDINVHQINKAYNIEIIEDEKTDYSTSKFGILEEKLRSMPVKAL